MYYQELCYCFDRSVASRAPSLSESDSGARERRSFRARAKTSQRPSMLFSTRSRCERMAENRGSMATWVLQARQGFRPGHRDQGARLGRCPEASRGLECPTTSVSPDKPSHITGEQYMQFSRLHLCKNQNHCFVVQCALLPVLMSLVLYTIILLVKMKFWKHQI